MKKIILSTTLSLFGLLIVEKAEAQANDPGMYWADKTCSYGGMYACSIFALNNTLRSFDGARLTGRLKRKEKLLRVMNATTGEIKIENRDELNFIITLDGFEDCIPIRDFLNSHSKYNLEDGFYVEQKFASQMGFNTTNGFNVKAGAYEIVVLGNDTYQIIYNNLDLK